MIGRTNAKRGGSGNITEVQVVPATQGATVTASRTGKSKTAVTDSNGVATFKNLDMGYDWTFTWSTFSVTEKIDQLSESIILGQISIDLYYYQENPNGWVKIYEGQTTTGTPVFDETADSTKNQWLRLGSFDAVPGQIYTFTGAFGLNFFPYHCTKNSENGTELLPSGYTGGSFEITATSDMESIWLKTVDI